ncbi:MAG: hypothetical protein ABIP90_03805 [Vicinamibacterales bacterium]
MHRLSSALVLAGAMLLTTYVSAPAAPTPEVARVSAAELNVIDATAPAAHAAEQEVARLRARLAVVPDKPVAQRDPFRFGLTPPRAPRAVVAAEPVAAMAEVVEPPAVVWPKLVALLSDKGAMTAVLGLGDAVEMLKAGETTGGFLVREITATSIEVVHVASSVVTRLTLR